MIPCQAMHPPKRARGLSLIDAVATLAILGAVTVPIATGIASLSRGNLQNYRDTGVRCALVYETERLRALPFASLSVGSTTTSIDLPGGASDLTVVISPADFDGDLAADADFKLVAASLDGREIRLFRGNWVE